MPTSHVAPPRFPLFARHLGPWLLGLAVFTFVAPVTAAPIQTDTQRGGNVALEPVLAGEFALQNGQLKEAASHYLTAAKRTGDAGLAERATRIALLADDSQTAGEALKLWQAKATPTLAMRGIVATLALRNGEAAKAEQTLEALVRDPDPRGWRHALLALSSGGKETQLAAKVLGKLHARGALPKGMKPGLAFAGLAQRLQDQALARTMAESVISAYPQAVEAKLLKATLARESGDLDGARAQLDALRADAKGQPGMLLALAGEYDSLGDPVAANAVLADMPQNLATQATRASLYSKAKDDAGLAKLYTEVEQDVRNTDVRRQLLLGTIAESLKRYDDALRWYDSIAGSELRDSARLRHASTQYAMGKKTEAFAALRALQNDDGVEDDVRRDAYLVEAEFRQKDGAREAEFDTYARGLAMIPDDIALLYSRALAWERFDRIDMAEADLRKILVIDPQNVAALNALGYTLADRTTRYEEALQLIDRARAAEPGNSAIIDSHGWVLYRLGRTEEALVQVRRAYLLQKDPEVTAHLGELLWVLGRKDEARKYFEEAKKLDPENRALKRALEKFGVTL